MRELEQGLDYAKGDIRTNGHSQRKTISGSFMAASLGHRAELRDTSQDGFRATAYAYAVQLYYSRYRYSCTTGTAVLASQVPVQLYCTQVPVQLYYRYHTGSAEL